jgi:Transcriptional regulator containing an amidase domain and an AraC-type DNA-binding HTH domain
MRQHINAHLSAEDIARHCGLSRRQLDRSLAREIGLTVRQAYMEMKFDHACWLMLRTSRTLSQIATDSGFTDAAHFSRQFRLRTGTTPAKWRHTNTLERAD